MNSDPHCRVPREDPIVAESGDAVKNPEDPALSESQRRRAFIELATADRSRFGPRKRHAKLTIRVGSLLQGRLRNMQRQYYVDQTLLIEIALDRLLSSLGF